MNRKKIKRNAVIVTVILFLGTAVYLNWNYGAREDRAALAAEEEQEAPVMDAAEEAAIRAYEAYLARYVEALRAAGSPYAFQTVGSALAARASAYAACGAREAFIERRICDESTFAKGVGESMRI